MSNKNSSTPTQKCNIKSISERFSALNLLDPRSPTTAFQRTPIQVILKNSNYVTPEEHPQECLDEVSTKTTPSTSSFVSLSSPPTNVEESLELSASSASYLSLENLTDLDSINLSSNDLSIVVSDCSSLKDDLSPISSDETDHMVQECVDEINIILEEKPAITPDNSMNILEVTSEESTKTTQTSTDDSSQCSNVTDSSLNVPLIKKNLVKNKFYTPNPNKKRNPLGPVENTCPTTPPSHLSYGSPRPTFRENQWKRIQEERKKLGLEADENTQLPLYDITASAPSKLMRKSRLQARFNVMS